MENLQIAKDLIERIKTGVETENGEIREFDIIDFLNLYGLDIIKFYDEVKDYFRGEERKLLSLFYTKYIPSRFIEYTDSVTLSNEYDYHIMMNTTYIENAQLDEKNQLIPGTGVLISDEDKLRIIEYYDSFGIRVTYKMLYCAIKRIGQGYGLGESGREM